MSRRSSVSVPHRGRQTWRTERAFLAATCGLLRIDAFSLDIAASARNAVAPRFFTKADNALEQNWDAGRFGWGWLNPPFGSLAPWMTYALEQRARGHQFAVLVPAAVGSNWWATSVHGRVPVLFLNGRVTFIGAAGPYPKDCALLLYHRRLRPTYQTWRWRDEARPAGLIGRAA